MSAAPSMTRAIAESETAPGLSQGGLEVLTRSGASFDSILVAERLPDGDAHLVEASYTWEGMSLRFPLELRRTDQAGWRIHWAPTAAYSRALLRVTREQNMPETSEGTVWTDRASVPAFPTVVTPDAFVTPFGRIASKGTRGISAPKGFKRHLSRWVRDVSRSDEAGGALDVIASREVPWRRITQVLFGASGFGYVRVNLLFAAYDGSSPVSRSYLAPVSFDDDGNRRPPSLVVGLYGIAPRYRFRVSIGGKLLSGEQTCGRDPDEATMSLCLSTLDTFSDGLRSLIRRRGEAPRISRVVLASTGSLALEHVAPLLERLSKALGIPNDRLMLGHIRAPSRRPDAP